MAVIILILAKSIAIAQENQIFVIEPLLIEVSSNQTVAISFPSAVKAVDRGSPQLLAQKVKSTENVLLIKAASPEMKPTSLIVITTDGQLHSFEVTYQSVPSATSVQLLPRQHSVAAVLSGQQGQRRLDSLIRIAKEYQSNIRRKSSAGKVTATLDGLFIKENLMLLRLKLENASPINYDIETMRIYIHDKKQIRRSAIQQQEILPVAVSDTINQIKTTEQQTIVLAIPKLTLTSRKRLSISLTEQNGARQLTIHVKPRQINRPATL
ncbi:Bacteroides conjugative transposon TraN protein [Dyadobacter soli]|uniref:Bacteroides conjugative transposon TraN protein n=2 Tax=Dyadobacter soli TaxID=659014 RepID=A0A1G7MGB6_9BACT|nr:Bacteroides conjugative transposon TraN protein [Dyadobacter soli]